MKKILLLLLCLMVVSACSENSPHESIEETVEETVPVIATDYEDGFQIFEEKELMSGLYEPVKDCYIGAYILSEKSVGQNIDNFERIVGKEHAFYTYYLKMGQPFPTEWILDCISKVKTPNIVLVPENIDEPFNTKFLEETAKKFGEFYVPMFVHFYPVTNSVYSSAEDYRNFYKTARVYFSRYASNVAFVWDISSDDLDLINDFYPGDESVDWVGINLYCNVESGAADTQLANIYSKLDYFYYTFQQIKPIFISELAVSHFSSEEHAYSVNEAEEVMESIYNRAGEEYPRIKAINYMSYNSIEPVNMGQDIYNYSVADSSKMTGVYKKCITGDNFINVVDVSSGSEMISQKISYPFNAVYYNNVFYTAKEIAEIIGATNFSEKELIILENEDYYNLNGSLGSNKTVKGDFNKRKVEIVNK